VRRVLLYLYFVFVCFIGFFRGPFLPEIMTMTTVMMMNDRFCSHITVVVVVVVDFFNKNFVKTKSTHATWKKEIYQQVKIPHNGIRTDKINSTSPKLDVNKRSCTEFELYNRDR